MPAAPRPPGAPGPAHAAARPRARRAAGLGVAALLAALVYAVGRDREGPPPGPRAPEGHANEAAEPGPPPATPEPARGSLAAALGEEQIALDAGVIIEAVEQERPWACAGASLKLFARVGGEREPGALTRWLWQGPSGVELEPGPTLSWRAPQAPGRYRLRVQVCNDLGGRRVGILAEREHAIEVRACGAADEAGGPLRVRVARLPGGAFRFEASHEGGEPPLDYTWDFDDGSPRTEAGPSVEHAFETAGLGPHEVRAFAVRVAARPASGGPPLEATAFAVVRGRPAPRDAPPVELDVARWRPTPEGGFRSPLALRAPPGTAITWERLERVTQSWDDRTRSVTLALDEALRIDERFEGGGFRGEAIVSERDSGPEVKQVHDFLYGRDARGAEVVVSWTPFKREAPPGGGGGGPSAPAGEGAVD
ncbi:MAG TPA: PKD domain-containing protein [Polyangiaceae bacterium]|nr:PKD domain-containing protein [Polyangiaceae bacterium]